MPKLTTAGLRRRALEMLILARDERDRDMAAAFRQMAQAYEMLAQKREGRVETQH
jgi:hypothetical protein